MEFNEENFKKLLASNTDLTTQFDALKANQDKLLSEAKDAKEKKRIIEEAAEQERIDAAKKLEQQNLDSGNHKELYESAVKKLEATEGLLSDMVNKSNKGMVSSAATKIAAELAEGSNVKLLAEFVTKRLKVDGDELKVLDPSGALTISSLADLTNEFKSDESFNALLKGNGSSGGSANGNGNGGGAASNNPWKKETRNLTEQAKILESDPTLAGQLKKAASAS